MPRLGARRAARADSRWRIGRAKAAVLPVPVGASASRSRPARRGGIAAALDRASAPRSRARRASSRSAAASPRAAKVVGSASVMGAAYSAWRPQPVRRHCHPRWRRLPASRPAGSGAAAPSGATRHRTRRTSRRRGTTSVTHGDGADLLSGRGASAGGVRRCGVHGGRGDPVLRAVRAGPGFVRLRPEHVPRLSVLRGRLLRGLLNLVDKACLACAPFRLTGATTRPRIVVAADLPPTTARVDRYADLRSDPETLPSTDAGAASRGPARQRPRDVAPGATPRPGWHDRARPGSRAGRPHGLLDCFAAPPEAPRRARRTGGLGGMGRRRRAGSRGPGGLARAGGPRPPRGRAVGRAVGCAEPGDDARSRPSDGDPAGDARASCHAAAEPAEPRSDQATGHTATDAAPCQACRGRAAAGPHAGPDGDRRSDPSDRRAVAGPPQGSTWRSAKSTLAGRSASRRMYHGYQCLP